MEFRGRIYKIFPVQSGTSARGNEWQKLDFIFEYFENPTDRYSDKVLLSIMNDRIDQYDLHENDEVVIGFGHSVREYQGRYFNDVRLYKLEKLATAKPSYTDNGAATPQQQNLFAQAPQDAPQSTNGQQVEQQSADPFTNAQTGGKEDDLPF